MKNLFAKFVQFFAALSILQGQASLGDIRSRRHILARKWFAAKYRVRYECRVINLARQAKKYKAFLDRNRVTGLVFSRFDAIDGSKLTRADFVKRGLLEAHVTQYTQGAIGCAASHFTLWKQAVQQQKNLLVFEDDTYCRHDITERLAEILPSLENWDVILLGCNTDAIVSLRMSEQWSFAGLFSIPYPSQKQLGAFAETTGKVAALRLDHAFGTCAYLVSPQGAQKLTSLFPLSRRTVVLPRVDTKFDTGTFHCGSIDTLMNTLYGSMNAYVTIPPLAMPLNDQFSSTTRG